ncbi:MAG: trypsin-like serine protease [Pseudomonadota bacterium]|nr:trypsin-like serine protease [Pseudomonadota bacterium]
MIQIIQFFSVILLVCLTVPVHSITNGGADNNAHPYVGLAVFKDIDGNPLWRCSGTLIAPQLFLTAGHCTNLPAMSATIWFEEDVDAGIPDNGYPFGGPTSIDGSAIYTHPYYNSILFFLYDLGMVILNEPMYFATYGMLPELGQLNALKTQRGKQDVTFTAVGYGLQKINPVFLKGERVRLKATLRLVNLTGTAGIPEGTSVILSSNANTGGTCFGDSGGPLFMDNTNIIAAVTSFGLNGNCAGIGGGYRVDTEDDLEWIESFFGDLLDF